MTQSPQPGEILTSESVKLLKAGDVVEALSDDRAGGWKAGDRLTITCPSGWICFKDADGDDRDRGDFHNFRLAAPSAESAGDLGSFSQAKIPTVQADDPWAELERLALAATPGGWRVDPNAYADIQTHNGRYEIATTDGVGLPDTKSSRHRAAPNARFIAAANPYTVLKLIEAARASQVGMERGNAVRNEPKPPAGDVAGARERLSSIEAAEYGAGYAVSVMDVYGEEPEHQLYTDLREILSDYDRLEEECRASMVEIEHLRNEADRQGEDNERLRGALELAANRLDRLSLETPPAGRLRAESVEWIAEARNAACARQGGHDNG